MNDEQVLRRWRSEVRRTIPHADAELVEEIAQHLGQRWLSAKAEGLSDTAADMRVRCDLDEWRRTPVPHRSGASRIGVGLAGDLRYGIRALRANPVSSAASILLTAIAIATTVAAFAIAYGILWRPLSYPDSERLGVLWQVREGEQGQIAYPDYADVSQASVFDGASVIEAGRGSLRIGEDTERVGLIWLEPRGYAMLGATPVRGRLLNAGDAGRRVVMISHRLWTSKLSADPNIIGRELWISGSTYSVAGVLAPGFDFELPVSPVFRLRQYDVWAVFDASPPKVSDRSLSTFEAIVRLAPGATFAQAQAAADTAAERLARTYPDTNANRTFRVRPLRSEIVRFARVPLLLACGAALAALVIALANLVALTLVRLGDRRAELAVRAALGAGIWRLRRQLFLEHLVTAIIGGVAGVLLAALAVRAAIGSAAADLPRAGAVAFDGPVYVAALSVVAMIAGVLTLLPLRGVISPTALRTAGRGTTASGRRARQILVAGELALALALSAGGALVGLSLVKLFNVDPGFSPAGVAAVRFSAYDARYPRVEHVTAVVQSILDRVETMPGVAHAAASFSLPLSGQFTGTTIEQEGTNLPIGLRPQAGWQFVTPGYFAVLGIPVLRGRDFTAADRDQAGHVTIINDELAHELFGDADPIGRRLSTGSNDWHVVIGVVGSVRHIALNVSPEPRIYDLFGEHSGRTLYIIAQSHTSDAAPLIPAIRQAIRTIDREAPVFESATMTALVARSAGAYRLAASLAGVVALASIVLALVGVYAVMAASVSGRTREIGVRAALGASPASLRRLILGEGAIIAGAGCAIGLAGAVAVARVLHAQLFGIRVADIALILPAVSAAVLVAALAAALPAARRAGGADPLVVMRTE